MDIFNCDCCGKKVIIKSKFVDGSVYYYLCVSCYKNKYKIKKELIK